MKNMFNKLFYQKKVFIGYITAGHKGLDYTEEAAVALVEGGVDILEIGLPFSDPIADGPIIQAAMTDALSYEFSLDAIFATINNIKIRAKAPIVLFTYYNPLLSQGLLTILTKAKSAGVDAVLVVDISLEESQEYHSICESLDLVTIGLLSPTTTLERAKNISENNQGFLYYVCRNGTTGIKTFLPDNYKKQMTHLKTHASLPIVSGFGISTKEMATEALSVSDGFVVGSAFVKAIIENATPADLKHLAQTIDPR